MIRRRERRHRRRYTRSSRRREPIPWNPCIIFCSCSVATNGLDRREWSGRSFFPFPRSGSTRIALEFPGVCSDSFLVSDLMPGSEMSCRHGIVDRLRIGLARQEVAVIELGVLHSHILKHIIGRGFAPELTDLAKTFSCSLEDVKASLVALQEYHGVVLHPSLDKIWVIHPFSLAPTLFTLKSARGAWWGNCAWCSLGAAALLAEDVSITTTLGGQDQQITINIKNGMLDRNDLFVHFPIPMAQAWENVIYTCSNMLLFNSETEVDNWVLRHNIPRGDLQPISRIWEFSKVWYGNHLNIDWKKWNTNEAKELFKRFELTGKIWDLEETGKRF